MAGVQSELASLAAGLEAATAPAADAPATLTDSTRAAEILQNFLQPEFKVTADDLRVTKAGLLVGKLAKNTASAEVATLAKVVLARWKAAVKPAAASAPAAAAPAPPAAASPPSAKVEAAKESADKKRKAEKEREEQPKRSKTESSPSPSPPARTSSAVPSNAPLAEQFPELTAGPFGLFKTEDSARDKMQHLLWTSLGEPSARVLSLQQASSNKSARTMDLSAYKQVGTAAAASPADAEMKDAATAAAPAGEAVPAAASGPLSVSIPSASSSAAAAAATPGTPHPVYACRTRVELAKSIEAAMVAKAMKENASIKCAGDAALSQSYKQKYRDIAPQLRDPSNEELRESLYLGVLTPDELVNAPLSKLAPSSLKEKREKEAAYNREAARCDIGQDAGATDIFQCDMCKGRRCTYFQMQTRGADEPMTIFVTCLDCGNKFRSGDGER